ncbi:RICIN domain-containing protein [Alteromonas sp. 1_MG-2023]|uniref:RICIN domain-containing protein n=1 Tax=Alteromonas sp. 1_MG-2023 TaxID=3062669 RepID=UPI0026E3D6E2|nr:RICIN domain-containing protein [Alteromonas sp. 1_MG-2023]MDO6474125.1 RICIN domain-containing protein [Alteromonas sp. 1_MG-2023]
MKITTLHESGPSLLTAAFPRKMKKFIQHAACGAVIALSSTHMAYANFVSTQGNKIVDEQGNELFLSGINLGNWLVWEGYLMMGDFNYRTHTQFFNELAGALGSSDKAAEFEYQWRLNYVDEQAIADLKGLGFNSVRVPFNYNLFWWNNQLRDNGFEYFDRLIEWCRKYDMYVLLDMHGAPGYQNPGDHADNVNSNASQPRDSVTFWDGNNVQIAATIWRHIANRYKDEPVVWGYDLINEPVPQDGREYELLPSFITMRNAIREVDNNHIIVAEGSWWGSDLSKIDWSNGDTQARTGINYKWDDKLVYQIHHYGPVADTKGRENITNNLNIPLIIGEYGETDNGNLLAITNWAKQNLAGYFPWSFKKMSHDRTLWTIPTNNAYEQVKAYINNGGTPPVHLYDAMLDFAQNNVRNGHASHTWHQDFYDGVKPDVTTTSCNSSGSGALASGTYIISNVASGRAMDVANVSVADGANIQVWDNFNAANQRWQAVEVGSNVYEFISQNSGSCLDADNGSDNVHQWSCFGSDNQRWALKSLPNGSFRVCSVAGQSALEAQGTGNGANVRTAAATGGDSQSWWFSPVQ